MGCSLPGRCYLDGLYLRILLCTPVSDFSFNLWRVSVRVKSYFACSRLRIFPESLLNQHCPQMACCLILEFIYVLIAISASVSWQQQISLRVGYAFKYSFYLHKMWWIKYTLIFTTALVFCDDGTEQNTLKAWKYLMHVLFKLHWSVSTGSGDSFLMLRNHESVTPHVKTQLNS